MIGSFKKRSTGPNQEHNRTDKAAKKVADSLLLVQLKISNWLNKSFAGMPVRKIKNMLFVFCILCGGISIYIVIDAVTGKPAPVRSPDKIDVLSNATHEEQTIIADTISDDMYSTIQHYKYYMDSLGLAMRPGLADSIKAIEQIYLSQKNK